MRVRAPTFYQPPKTTTMQTSLNQYIIPRLGRGKKRDEVDKGTTRKTPGNNKGARPPEEEDFDKIHEQNQKKKAQKRH